MNSLLKISWTIRFSNWAPIISIVCPVIIPDCFRFCFVSTWYYLSIMVHGCIEDSHRWFCRMHFHGTIFRLDGLFGRNRRPVFYLWLWKCGVHRRHCFFVAVLQLVVVIILKIIFTLELDSRPYTCSTEFVRLPRCISHQVNGGFDGSVNYHGGWYSVQFCGSWTKGCCWCRRKRDNKSRNDESQEM